MSQQPTPIPSAPSIPYPQYVMVPAQAGNGLGVAGFFIAAIGLLIPTGIVALLGLLVSLVALGKAPRGFAGMGVLVGLVGTAIWMAITGVAIVGALAIGIGAVLFGAVAFVLMQPEIIEVTSDMGNVLIVAFEYEDEHGQLPDGLDSLVLSRCDGVGGRMFGCKHLSVHFSARQIRQFGKLHEFSGYHEIRQQFTQQIP